MPTLRLRTVYVGPPFWEGKELARVSRRARFLYLGMSAIADNDGILRGHPLYIRGQVFPYDTDWAATEIDGLIDQLADIGRVRRYQIDGETFIHLLHIGEVRRPSGGILRPWIPRALRNLVYARDGHACVSCGATERLSLDHIIPWSLGGSDTEHNLQTMCRPCNSRKGARV